MRGRTVRKTAGNRCLNGWCDCGGSVGGAGQEAGILLPAKMPKRLEKLREILGPPPPGGYPEELLRPPGKKSEGKLGNVRYAKAHVREGSPRSGVWTRTDRSAS